MAVSETSPGRSPASVASSKLSGRTPTTTRPVCVIPASSPSSESAIVPSDEVSEPSATSPMRKFIAGAPMKPATNRFSGRLIELGRSSDLLDTPSRMTARRSPSVIASV